MRLVIVGSMAKAWTRETEKHAKQLIETVILGYIKEHGSDLEIGSGESPAGGVDIWVHEIANRLNVRFTPFPPDGRGWEYYKKRDQAMADWCHELVRIKSSKSKTYGSGWTRDRAAEQGKPTREYTL